MLRAEEFNKLEAKWIKHKKRERTKLLLYIAISCFMIFLLVVFLINISLSTNKNLDQNNTTVTKNKADAILPLDNSTKNNNKTLDNTSYKNQSKDFINHVQEKTQNNQTKPNKSQDIKNDATIVKTNIKPEVNKTAIVNNGSVQENKILIKTSNINNIQTLINRFNDTRNIVFANMISEEYYEQKNYKSSRNWAIEANKIDPNNEQSWILFAKSSVKDGKKDEAIHALKIYIKHFPKANNAISLLRSIQNGSFN